MVGSGSLGVRPSVDNPYTTGINWGISVYHTYTVTRIISHIYISIYRSIDLYLYLYLYVSISMYLSLSIYLCVSIYVSISMYLSILLSI
jgi:hypothetical protein